jgi:hypothetical protein
LCAAGNAKCCEQRPRRLFHFQEPRGRADVPDHHPEISHQRPQLSHYANQRSRFTHYYFYIRDEVLGPFVMCMGSFFPFKATYYLDGHSFIEHQLSRAKIGFR